MGQAITRVRVADFDQFIETFQTRGKEKRAEHGSRGVTVYRSAEDPNEVINVFEWDQADAESFLADPEVQEIMREAGLEGPPEITYVERVTELDA